MGGIKPGDDVDRLYEKKNPWAVKFVWTLFSKDHWNNLRIKKGLSQMSWAAAKRRKIKYFFVNIKTRSKESARKVKKQRRLMEIKWPARRWEGTLSNWDLWKRFQFYHANKLGSVKAQTNRCSGEKVFARLKFKQWRRNIIIVNKLFWDREWNWGCKASWIFRL